MALFPSLRRVRLILARHTETDDNAQQLYSGQRNVSLNDIGRRQAAELSRSLASFKIVRVVTSDLMRAEEVGKTVLWNHPTSVQLSRDVRLREVHVGRMAGMTKEQARLEFPLPHFSTHHPEFDFTSIGGETRAAVLTRQFDCLNALVAEHGVSMSPYSTLCVVGHGSALRILYEAFGLPYPLQQGNFDLVEYEKNRLMPL